MPSSLVKDYKKNKQDFTTYLDYYSLMNADAKNISKNLRLLMKYHKDSQHRAAKRCGGNVSQKTISNLLNPKDDTAPNLDIVTKVANGYKIKTWMLLLPDAPIEILLNHQLQKHIDNYLHADKSTRDFVSHVLEGPAEDYKKTDKIL